MLRISDLKRASEIDFIAGPLGPARAKAFFGDFETWLSEGVEERRWPDGARFVRELLSAQCVRPYDGGSFAKASIETLSGADLDDVGDAFFEAIGGHFHPRHIATGEGKRRRVRRRTKLNAYDASKASEEGGAARLLRVLGDFAQDRRDGYKMLSQPSETIFSVMDAVTGPALGEVPGRAQSAADMLFGRFSEPTAGLLGEAASGRYGVAAHDRLLEAATGAGSLTRTREAVEGLLSVRTGALDAAVGLGPSFGQLLTAPDTAVRGFFGDHRPAVGLAQAAGLARHPNLGSAIDRFFEADRSAAAAVIAAATGRIVSFPDGLGVSAAFDRGFSSSIADQSRLATLLDRRFDLGVSDPFRSMLLTAEKIHDFAAGRSVFPPGFQLTAAAGLRDVTLSGSAAAILRHYGDSSDDAPVFAAAMSSATAFDDVEIDGAAATERLKELAALIAQELPRQPDPVVRRGYLEVLGLVLNTIAVATGVVAAWAALSGPTASDMAANTAEIRGQRSDMAANERRRAEDDRRLRYLHGRATLRAEARPDAPVIGRLYPDQMLRVVDESGAWLLVEVMDYRTDAVTRGWLNRAQVRIRPRN